MPFKSSQVCPAAFYGKATLLELIRILSRVFEVRNQGDAPGCEHASDLPQGLGAGGAVVDVVQGPTGDDDIKVGDILEAYVRETFQRTL